MVQRFLDSWGNLLWLLNPRSLNPQSPRYLIETDVRVANTKRRWEGVFRYLVFAPILQNVELQYLIALIVADDEFSIDLVVCSGPERLDSVHAAAIARKADYRFIWMGYFDTNGPRNADA